MVGVGVLVGVVPAPGPGVVVAVFDVATDAAAALNMESPDLVGSNANPPRWEGAGDGIPRL